MGRCSKKEIREVESHYRDKEDRGNRGEFEKPISFPQAESRKPPPPWPFRGTASKVQRRLSATSTPFVRSHEKARPGRVAGRGNSLER